MSDTDELAPAVAPRLVYDESRTTALIVRPRWLLAVLGVIAPVAGLALLLTLSYDAASFDPRIAMVAVYAVIGPLSVLRARLVVAGGALWRRGLSRRLSGVELEHLAAIEVRRARFFKHEGWVRTVAVVTDQSGRSVSFKPLLWSGGASELLAGLATLARAQGLELDQATAERLARASASTPNVASTWSSPVVSYEAARGSSFWIRVDETGKPSRVQWRLLLAVVAMIVVAFPAALTVGGKGTQAVRSLRCSNDRHLWSHPDVAPAASVPDPDVLGEGLSARAVHPGTIYGYPLAPRNVANEHNTTAVQRDAERLVPGSQLVQWTDGGQLRAEVYIELFDSPDAAIAFQRDYAEDHCHLGDRAFATTEIPGGVGFRCQCSGSVVDDRVSFVRGSTRIQAIEWVVPERAGHEAAIDLARQVLQVMER